jgi:hypothetical protein
MTERIDRIYYFDYTKDIGHYDSIRNFSSEEMSYIGLALSTPKIYVNSSPHSFNISIEGSSRIREYAISRMSSLQEISKDLAVNSPRYILICYFDGTERYFSYNEAFCSLFKLVVQYEPCKEVENQYVSPFAIQKNDTVPAPNYARPTQNQTVDYTTPRTYPQQQTVSRTPSSQKRQDFPWKVILGIGILVLIIIVIINGITEESNIDAGLTPVSEPQSGAILSGTAVYDGSEITITASGGESCVVKLKTRFGTERMSFYVRAGDTVTVGVPAEYLYVYFASGDTWYGTTYLFGEKTNYSMDDQICDFTEYTWKYTLYPVSNGNFSQTPIDEDKFK